MLVFIAFSVFCKSVLDTSLLCHGEQWCQFHGFTDSLQSLQLNEIFEFEMYDISMASLCTWKNEAFEACVVMVTLPDRLPVKNYPYPIPEESATRHSPKTFVATVPQPLTSGGPCNRPSSAIDETPDAVKGAFGAHRDSCCT